MNSWTRDVGLEAFEGVDEVFSGLVAFGENDADALCAFQQFNHERRAADHFNEVLGVELGVCEAGPRDIDVFRAEHLERAEFILCAADGDGAVQAVGALHFELAQNRHGVKGEGGTNARNDGVKALEDFAAAIVDFRLARGDVHIAVADRDEMHLVAAVAAGLHQAPV
jgi:hypothetical protein